jgi:hypothetical protein
MSAPHTPERDAHVRQLATMLDEAVRQLEYVLCTNKVCLCSAAEEILGNILNIVFDARALALSGAPDAQPLTAPQGGAQ